MKKHHSTQQHRSSEQGQPYSQFDARQRFSNNEDIGRYSRGDLYNSDSGYAQNNRGMQFSNEYNNGNYRNQYDHGNYRSGYNSYDYGSSFDPDYNEHMDDRDRYNDDYSRNVNDYGDDYSNDYESRNINDNSGRRYRDTSASFSGPPSDHYGRPHHASENDSSRSRKYHQSDPDYRGRSNHGEWHGYDPAPQGRQGNRSGRDEDYNGRNRS